MFDHFVWSVMVIPVLLVAVTIPLAIHLNPAAAATALAWSAAAVAFAGLTNLAVFTAKALAERPAIADHFGWPRETVLWDTTRVPWVPWVSAAWLACAAVSMSLVWRRHRRGRHVAKEFVGLPADHQVVLVDTPVVDAFAVPGRLGSPGRIVVTTGMRDALTPRQYEALLAHERAHLEARHPRLVLLADLAKAAHPALFWVPGRISYLVERAADESAAHRVGDRRIVARAIAAAALATATRPSAYAQAGPSFAATGRPGNITARVTHLLSSARTERARWLVLVPVVLAASSVVWTGEALCDLYGLLRKATSEAL